MIPKFRAWDKEENKMRNNVNVITNENGTLEALILKYEFNGYDFTELEVIEYDSVYFYNQDEFPYTIMQYTGLIDVNGVEIFEGDILSRKTHVWMYGSDLNEWVTESHPVVWQDGGWYLNEEPLAFILEEGVYRDGFRRTALEVIGNIYENPGLLEMTE